MDYSLRLMDVSWASCIFSEDRRVIKCSVPQDLLYAVYIGDKKKIAIKYS